MTCTVAVAFAAKLPRLQLSAPLAIKQAPGPVYGGLMVQPTPVPDGNESLRLAEMAAPEPLLLAASVYPIEEPAATVAASAVCVRFSAGVRSGHSTVAVADACIELLLPALSVAVLAYDAQLDVEVVLVTCTDAVLPDARFPRLQLNSWPFSEQVPGPLYAGLMLQVMPVPVGNVSLKVAEVAVPAPVLAIASV